MKSPPLIHEDLHKRFMCGAADQAYPVAINIEAETLKTIP